MADALDFVIYPKFNFVVCTWYKVVLARHILRLQHKIPGAMGAGGRIIGLQRR